MSHDPHMLDVTALVRQARVEVSEQTIARCWIKADVLPRVAHMFVEDQHGKVNKQKRKPADEDLTKMAKLTRVFRHL